jgi:hypothetical protein
MAGMLAPFPSHTTALLAALVLGVGALGAGSGCAASTSDDPNGGGAEQGDEADLTRRPNDAQMNDVTTVLPLAKTQSEFDSYLAATSAGVGGPLLPKALYTKVIPDPTGPIGVGADVQMRYANLRLVALRFDPCFANVGPITDPGSCQNQLRVIFQSLEFKDGSTSAIDGAVHAFYSLTRDELTTAIQEVVALRHASGQTADLGALQPHPLVVKQGLDGAYAKGLAKIVLEHAGASKLIRFTHFSGHNLATSWDFVGFDVAHGATTPMVIPTLPASTKSVNFFAGFGAPIAGGFTPATTSKDDIGVLVNIEKATAATPAARQAAYDAAIRIQSPDHDSPNTIDCASCHVAQAAQVLIGEGKFNLSASADSKPFARNTKYVSAADFKQTTSPTKQASGFNVHMLSYKSTALQIGQRVINETAAVVAYVNSEVLPK